MNRLWRATTMLAQDKALRAASVAVAAFVVKPALAPDLRNQPKPEALHAIDLLFRERGVHLCLYDLAEVNRWMVLAGTDATVAGLWDQYWGVLRPAALLASAAEFPVFQEAAGALMLDSGFRGRVASGTDQIGVRGFALAPAVEEALRLAVSTQQADVLANDFVNRSWNGEPCLVRLDPYANYIHPNI